MPRRLSPRSSLALLAAAALALTACSPATETSDSASPTPSSPSAEIADTAAGAKTAWIIDVLDAEQDTTAAEWEPHLDTTFTAEVSAAEVAELLNTQIRPAAPFTVTAYQGDERSAVATLKGTIGEAFDMTVAINDEDKIVALLLGPASEP